jgi:hypothetical protein
VSDSITVQYGSHPDQVADLSLPFALLTREDDQAMGRETPRLLLPSTVGAADYPGNVGERLKVTSLVAGSPPRPQPPVRHLPRETLYLNR